MALRDIMTTEVFTVSPDTTVAEAARAMVRGRFGSAVVLEGSWLVGIFTERDVLRSAAAGADPASATVGEWMTRDPVTAEPGTELAEAEQTLLTHGFRHLPVVEGGRVVGIVSLRDLLAARIRRPS